MSNDEVRNPRVELEVVEIEVAEEDSSPAVDQPVWGIERQEGIMGEDLLGAHLHLTAPDLGVLLPPMANLELREDACKLYKGLHPRNTSEAMLATLAVGLFNASLGSIAEGTRQDTPPAVRDINLKNGIKAAASVGDFLEKLRAMQSGNYQTVRVGNVNVEAGGQAIVGNVQSGRDRAKSDDKIKTTSSSQKRKRRGKSPSARIVEV